MQALIETLYREESRRIFATLVRLLGDFELAEESMQDAFAAAMQQWPRDGVPDNPRAWLISAARFKGIDQIRKNSRSTALPDEVVAQLADEDDPAIEDAHIPDDRLRLIFTCCHPALAPATRIALTLREVCGLSTEEIASAFLLRPTTLAQRLVRGKAKIRDAGIPYEVPDSQQLPERLDSVLSVIYLIFNEGYNASSGPSLTRPALCHEAIRLARLLRELLPHGETTGLLALMLLHDARRHARLDAHGELVLLEQQDRSLWDKAQIAEGQTLVQEALQQGPPGHYSLQAAIAALHAEAPSAADTDWPQIVALYDLLLQVQRSPVVELNRAVAIAMRDGATAGLALIDELMSRQQLDNYHLAHSARADLLRRLGRNNEAREAYQRALALTEQEPERRFLQRRLSELSEI